MTNYEFINLLIFVYRRYKEMRCCAIDSNEWRVFTGNEMGCLLIWWMIHVYKSKGEGPGKV